MSERGDNNKQGSSGRGASHQSAQGMQGGKKVGRQQTGGQPSQPQEKKQAQSTNRNCSTEGGNNSR